MIFNDEFVSIKFLNSTHLEDKNPQIHKIIKKDSLNWAKFNNLVSQGQSQ